MFSQEYLYVQLFKVHVKCKFNYRLGPIVFHMHVQYFGALLFF